MRTFEPIGVKHIENIITKDGHYIQKIYKRVSWDKFIFDGVVDYCEDVERAERRRIRYFMHLGAK